MTETLAQNVPPVELPPIPRPHLGPDGSFVKNFQEHPQSLILTDSIGTTLERIHPDGQYTIGQDCGIYWRETDPPEKGGSAGLVLCAKCTPKTERRDPTVLCVGERLFDHRLEFASGDGSGNTIELLSYSEESGTIRPQVLGL